MNALYWSGKIMGQDGSLMPPGVREIHQRVIPANWQPGYDNFFDNLPFPPPGGDDAFGPRGDPGDRAMPPQVPPEVPPSVPPPAPPSPDLPPVVPSQERDLESQMLESSPALPDVPVDSVVAPAPPAPPPSPVLPPRQVPADIIHASGMPGAGVRIGGEPAVVRRSSGDVVWNPRFPWGAYGGFPDVPPNASDLRGADGTVLSQPEPYANADGSFEDIPAAPTGTFADYRDWYNRTHRPKLSAPELYPKWRAARQVNRIAWKEAHRDEIEDDRAHQVDVHDYGEELDKWIRKEGRENFWGMVREAEDRGAEDGVEEVFARLREKENLRQERGDELKRRHDAAVDSHIARDLYGPPHAPHGTYREADSDFYDNVAFDEIMKLGGDPAYYMKIGVSPRTAIRMCLEKNAAKSKARQAIYDKWNADYDDRVRIDGLVSQYANNPDAAVLEIYRRGQGHGVNPHPIAVYQQLRDRAVRDRRRGGIIAGIMNRIKRRRQVENVNEMAAPQVRAIARTTRYFSSRSGRRRRRRNLRGRM